MRRGDEGEMSGGDEWRFGEARLDAERRRREAPRAFRAEVVVLEREVRERRVARERRAERHRGLGAEIIIGKVEGSEHCEILGDGGEMLGRCWSREVSTAVWGIVGSSEGRWGGIGGDRRR